MIIADLSSGNGITVIDPHGGLIDAAGTTPDPRGHPDDEPTPAVLMPALIALLFAQGDTSPVKSQDRSSASDGRQIMETSIAATQRDWKARLHYTYLERDEDRRRDLAGHVKSEDVEVSKTILVNGVPCCFQHRQIHRWRLRNHARAQVFVDANLEVFIPRICAALRIVTKSPSGGSTGDWYRGMFRKRRREPTWLAVKRSPVAVWRPWRFRMPAITSSGYKTASRRSSEIVSSSVRGPCGRSPRRNVSAVLAVTH